MMRMKKWLAFLAAVCLLLPGFAAAAEREAADEATILAIAQGVVDWKKRDNGSPADGFLLTPSFLEEAGTPAGDWYPIGLGRLGIEDNNEGYLAVIAEKVSQRYREENRLDKSKATEWHRISLAILAMGGDPTRIGADENGSPIDLIADGTYDRGKTVSLGRQGITGWIWGLIALDAMRYEIPDGAYYSRDDIITEILRLQLEDKGFALTGKRADPDVTAIVLQALAPYYNSEKVYTYQPKDGEGEISQTVRQAVDDALALLSALQKDTGDFSSWGIRNVESTVQVMVALCSLGLDPLTDERFIKNGNTLLDGILQYQHEDGGFVHSFVQDPENPGVLPDKSNSLAGEQALYAMAALWRQQKGMRTLYDFRPEQSEALKKRIAELEAAIGAMDASPARTELEALLTSYYSLPADERSYVGNYGTLSDAAKAAGVDIEKIAASTEVVESPDDEPDDTPTPSFSQADREAVEALPERLTTAQYAQVVTLLTKLSQSEDFEGKDGYLQRLTTAKEQIDALQAEIDAINAEVLEKLYPFDSISLKDKKTVDSLVARYNALSEYDRGKIDRWEDVVKTQTKLDNQLRGILIAVALVVAAGGITVFAALHIRKRRRSKRLAMEELAAQYADEEEEGTPPQEPQA